MKATIRKADGTVIEADGSAEEIAVLLAPRLAFAPSPPFTYNPTAGIVSTAGSAAIPFVWTTGETDHG